MVIQELVDVSAPINHSFPPNDSGWIQIYKKLHYKKNDFWHTRKIQSLDLSAWDSSIPRPLLRQRFVSCYLRQLQGLPRNFSSIALYLYACSLRFQLMSMKKNSRSCVQEKSCRSLLQGQYDRQKTGWGCSGEGRVTQHRVLVGVVTRTELGTVTTPHCLHEVQGKEY